MTWEQIQPLITCTLAGKALTGKLNHADALEAIYLVNSKSTLVAAVTDLVHVFSSPAGNVALKEITRLTK